MFVFLGFSRAVLTSRCVCECVSVCVCVCTSVCTSVYASRIVSMDKILCFSNTLSVSVEASAYWLTGWWTAWCVGSKGYFVHPTIVECKDPSNKLMQEVSRCMPPPLVTSGGSQTSPHSRVVHSRQSTLSEFFCYQHHFQRQVNKSQANKWLTGPDTRQSPARTASSKQ